MVRDIRQRGLAPDAALTAFFETLSTLSPDQLEAMVLEEVQNPDAFRFFSFPGSFYAKRHVARRLAEIAPEKAAQLWGSQEGLGRESGLFLTPWAKKDPQAFASWCLSLPPGKQRDAATALGSIAKDSPEQFAAIAPQIASSPAAARAAQTAMESFLRRPGQNAKAPDLDEALRFAKTLPEGPMRNAALVQMAAQRRIQDFATQPEAAQAIASLPWEEATWFGKTMASNAQKLPSGAARDIAFATMCRKEAEKDPAAAAQTLRSLASTSDYPAAVRGFVDATAMKDPAAAADWALSIPPAAAQQRAAALDRVAITLFRKDPESARAWVESAPLSPQEYFLLTGRHRSP
jgi:hypothetical protein